MEGRALLRQIIRALPCGKVAGAKLTDDVAYPAAAKVVVNHAQSAGAAEPVRITITAKQ